MEILLLIALLAGAGIIGLTLSRRRTEKKSSSSNESPMPHPNTPPPKQGEGTPLDLKYVDSNGEITSRRIDLIEVTVEHYDGALRPRMLIGWCHLRQDWRNFAFGRIETLTDPRTGEVYDQTGAIAGFLRLIATEDIALPDDRRFEGYRELDRTERDKKLLSDPAKVIIHWRNSNGKGAPRSSKVWINGVAQRPGGSAYALIAEPFRGGSEERPYFIKPLGSGHREILTLEEDETRHEGEAIARWAEERIGGPRIETSTS
jgi:hypothetical protein